MTRPSEARDEVLRRIRTALSRVPPGPELPWTMGPDEPVADAVPAPPPADLPLAFRARLEEVGGHVHVAASGAEAIDLVREIAQGAGARRVLHSDDRLILLCAEALSGELDCVAHDDEREELLRCDLGLTGAQWGVAETGTIVLESAAEHHRLASLLPPVHVALLETSRLVATLDDVLAELRADDVESMSRTITMITGPSRTADIELTLVVGVHGPRELHVVLVPPSGELPA